MRTMERQAHAADLLRSRPAHHFYTDSSGTGGQNGLKNQGKQRRGIKKRPNQATKKFKRRRKKRCKSRKIKAAASSRVFRYQPTKWAHDLVKTTDDSPETANRPFESRQDPLNKTPNQLDRESEASTREDIAIMRIPRPAGNPWCSGSGARHGEFIESKSSLQRVTHSGPSGSQRHVSWNWHKKVATQKRRKHNAQMHAKKGAKDTAKRGFFSKGKPGFVISKERLCELKSNADRQMVNDQVKFIRPDCNFVRISSNVLLLTEMLFLGRDDFVSHVAKSRIKRQKIRTQKSRAQQTRPKRYFSDFNKCSHCKRKGKLTIRPQPARMPLQSRAHLRLLSRPAPVRRLPRVLVRSVLQSQTSGQPMPPCSEYDNVGESS